VLLDVIGKFSFRMILNTNLQRKIMKDFTKKQLEENRPNLSAKEAINFCLQRIYADSIKTTNDFIVDGLTFEEIIGALLLARDKLG
jgi:hypothetical protein